MYYNYHSRIKQKIKEGLLIKDELVECYSKSIGRAMVLYFADGTKYPIREYRWFEYEGLI